MNTQPEEISRDWGHYAKKSSPHVIVQETINRNS